MTIYTVHLPPDAHEADEVAERAVFLKEGFAFFGFAFTGLWLLAQRLWWQALLYFVAFALISTLFWQFGLPRGAFVGVSFLMSLLIGIEGNEWIRGRFRRRGWIHAGTVSGPSLEECERRFFQDWVAAQGATRPAPPPLRPATAAPGPVLGVFPAPRTPLGGQAGRA
jgi:hypothetical protein